MWLDLARYADSAGYADDPPRTIWAYRDYVIRSFNANKPFDRFTVEQIAGDLLPDPTDDQLVATAFHRNTLTNNEGGTNDEEFRNVAVVDRVNTTMAVWMGTTIACAQCHDHKYDPLSQAEYFRLFAFFNNTEDADRTDESPDPPALHRRRRSGRRPTWDAEIAALETTLRDARRPSSLAGQARWERSFAADLVWQPLTPASAVGHERREADDPRRPLGPRRVDGQDRRLHGRRSRSTAAGSRPSGSKPCPTTPCPARARATRAGTSSSPACRPTIAPPGRHGRSAGSSGSSCPGKEKILSLAEVQVFRGRRERRPAGRGTPEQHRLRRPGQPGHRRQHRRRLRRGEVDHPHRRRPTTPGGRSTSRPTGPIDRVVDLEPDRQRPRRPGWPTSASSSSTRRASPSGRRAVAAPPEPERRARRRAATAPSPSPPPSPTTRSRLRGRRASSTTRTPGDKGWAVGGQAGQAARPDARPRGARSTVEPGSTLTVDDRAALEAENHTLGRFRARRPPTTTAPPTSPGPRRRSSRSSRPPAEARTEAQRAELTRLLPRRGRPRAEGRPATGWRPSRQQLAAMKPDDDRAGPPRAGRRRPPEDADPAPGELPRPRRRGRRGRPRRLPPAARRAPRATAWPWPAGWSPTTTR